MWEVFFAFHICIAHCVSELRWRPVAERAMRPHLDRDVIDSYRFGQRDQLGLTLCVGGILTGLQSTFGVAGEQNHGQ
jgi:hypothetical protein